MEDVEHGKRLITVGNTLSFFPSVVGWRSDDYSSSVEFFYHFCLLNAQGKSGFADFFSKCVLFLAMIRSVEESNFFCHGRTVTRMGPGSGFVFVCDDEKIVYFAGDTVFYDGVRTVIDRFQPGVIIVNACDARGKIGRLIMNAEDVKKTCDCKSDSIVIASHMNAVSHAFLSRDQLKKELAGTQYAKQVLVPEDGERIEII